MIFLVTKTYLSKKISEWMEVVAYKMAKQAKANLEKVQNDIDNLRSEIPNIQLYHSVTYSQLVQLRNNSKLVPGAWYRIIDYITKVANDPEAQSAGHPFDLLVMATSINSISEEARAIKTSRNSGSYFKNSNLSAWRVWYCLNNDSTRFMWASSTGTGVIYRLIDEWGNDFPYDFKNIQFKRYYTYDECGLHDDIEGTYAGINAPMMNLSIDESDSIFCYTISLGDRTTSPTDASLIGFNSSNIGEGYGEKGYFGNMSLKPATCIQTIDDDINSCFCLNNIVLFVNNARYRALGSTHIDGECINMTLSCIHSSIGSDNRNIIMADRCYNISIDQGCDALTFSQDCWGMSFSQYCYGMSFSQGCYEMSFSQGCVNMSFSQDCWGMSFSQSCGSMSFSQGCYDMSFSQHCNNMSFSQDCRRMSFSQYCYGMSFSQSCVNMSFSQNCHYMSFSQSCGSMSFSQDCWGMSFSQGCYEMSFSQDCRRMSFSQGCSRINVDAGVHDICLPENASNIHIFAGVHGDRYQPLGVATGADYTQFVAMQSDGNIRIYNPADVA